MDPSASEFDKVNDDSVQEHNRKPTSIKKKGSTTNDALRDTLSPIGIASTRPRRQTTLLTTSEEEQTMMPSEARDNLGSKPSKTAYNIGIPGRAQHSGIPGRAHSKAVIDTGSKALLEEWMKKADGDHNIAAGYWFEREAAKAQQPWPLLEEAKAQLAAMRSEKLDPRELKRRKEEDEEAEEEKQEQKRRSARVRRPVNRYRYPVTTEKTIVEATRERRTATVAKKGEPDLASKEISEVPKTSSAAAAAAEQEEPWPITKDGGTPSTLADSSRPPPS